LMRLARPTPAQALDLEFEAAPFLGPVHRRLPVEVWLNGSLLHSLVYEGVDKQPLDPVATRIPLPAGAVGEGGDVLLEWRVQAPRSPQSLGVAADSRALGLFVVKVALMERDGLPVAGAQPEE
jgi:hypothetical protein